MSNIKYGLISETDARTLEKTMDLICENFPDEMLKTCEVGLYSGLTSDAILKYIFNVKKRYTWHTGIDNNKDGEKLIHFPHGATLIIGNSSEVYNQIEDNSQHLIFVDGCHTFPAVIADFFCYAAKVKVGGYLAFHDTGKHINPLHGWQGVGNKNDPDMCLGGVRKALDNVGLFGAWVTFDDGRRPLWSEPQNDQWELVFDEADPNDEAGGICSFKKLF